MPPWDWNGEALQPEIGAPLSERNNRRGSYMPAAGRGAVRTRTFCCAIGGSAEPEVLPGDLNPFSINGWRMGVALG